MQDPLVSIIIPTYNRAHLIGETLESVLAQTYANWECIVVDDGSTDNTGDVLKQYVSKDKRFQYHIRPKSYKKGANSCRNYGFEISNGEYIQWFDDDDIMLPEFLNAKFSAFETGVDLVICSGSYTDENLNILKTIDLYEDTFLFKDYVFWKLHILTPSVLFKKSFLLRNQLFSLDISRGQETEFFSRLFFQLPESSYRIVNNALFLYRQHDGTKTHKNKAYVPKYKRSQSLIALENLKRATILHDGELMNYCYQGLLTNFFKSIKYQDIETSSFVLRGLLPIIKKRNLMLFFEMIIIGKLFIFTKRSSFRIKQRWKRITI